MFKSHPACEGAGGFFSTALGAEDNACRRCDSDRHPNVSESHGVK